jgi:hypothetical protein
VKLLLGLFVIGTIKNAGQAGFLTKDFGLLKVDCAITVSELLFWNLNSHISNATFSATKRQPQFYPAIANLAVPAPPRNDEFDVILPRARHSSPAG